MEHPPQVGGGMLANVGGDTENQPADHGGWAVYVSFTEEPSSEVQPETGEYPPIGGRGLVGRLG